MRSERRGRAREAPGPRSRRPRPSGTPEGTGAGVPDGPASIAARLTALGVRPARRLGQSFLADPFVADAEAALAEIRPGEPVLEIGGGLGLLTQALVRRGARPLTVIERDRRLADHLRATFGDRVDVRTGDALVEPLPDVRVAVGNLPFSVGTPLLLRLLAARVPRVVFLLQQEVAERLAASPGSKAYGRLAIAARLFGSVELYRTVPARAFYPEPEVAGRIGVHIAREGPLPVPSVADFEATVRTLFGSRRKQLGNLLPRLAPGAGEAEALADRAGWPADWRRRRPEELEPEAYFALARARAAGRPVSFDS